MGNEGISPEVSEQVALLEQVLQPPLLYETPMVITVFHPVCWDMSLEQILQPLSLYETEQKINASHRKYRNTRYVARPA